jgi:hypothetical protein
MKLVRHSPRMVKVLFYHETQIGAEPGSKEVEESPASKIKIIQRPEATGPCLTRPHAPFTKERSVKGCGTPRANSRAKPAAPVRVRFLCGDCHSGRCRAEGRGATFKPFTSYDGKKGERRLLRISKRLLYCVNVNRTSLDHLLLGKCADVDRTCRMD